MARSTATAAPQGLACLMMATAAPSVPPGGVGGQLVDQSPGGVGVEEVEIGEGGTAVLDHPVPPAVAGDQPVAGPGLVGVLAVAEDLGALEGEVDGGGQHGLGRRALGHRAGARSPSVSNQATMAAS